MDEKVLQLRVGMFVLMSLASLGFLIWLHSEIWKGQYSVYIKPHTAPGVTRNTPVRKNGILIGRVDSVETQDDHVVIRLRIDNDERIYSKEFASIGADSFLGDAVVEILPLPRDKRGEVITNDQLLGQVSVKRNPLEVFDVALNLEDKFSTTLVAVGEAGDAIRDAGQRVSAVAETVQDALGDENSDFKKLLVDFRQMSRKAQSALDNFNTIFENINNMVDDPETKGKFREIINELPKIFQEVRLTVVKTRETITSFRQISDSASKNLDNLELFTEALKKDGPEILAQVNGSLKNIDGLFEQFEAAAQSLSKLQNSEGTIGKLLNDPALYNSALETVNNVRDLSTRLEPLVHDLRMFADAIARDPGQLGISGAIKNRRQPAKTGSKGGFNPNRAFKRYVP